MVRPSRSWRHIKIGGTFLAGHFADVESNSSWGTCSGELDAQHFRNVSQKFRVAIVGDFRPVANSILFYKVFDYFMLGRLEDTMESFPSEQEVGRIFVDSEYVFG